METIELLQQINRLKVTKSELEAEQEIESVRIFFACTLHNQIQVTLNDKELAAKIHKVVVDTIIKEHNLKLALLQTKLMEEGGL